MELNPNMTGLHTVLSCAFIMPKKKKKKFMQTQTVDLEEISH